MKSKSKPNVDVKTPRYAYTCPSEEIRHRMIPAQEGALNTLLAALKVRAHDDVEGEITAMMKVLSLGFFVLGLDGAGDFCLDELTDALYGKGTKQSRDVWQGISDAGSEAWCEYINVERAERALRGRASSHVSA